MTAVIILVLAVVFYISIKSSFSFNVNDFIIDNGDIYGDPQKMYKALIGKHGYSKGEAIYIMYSDYGVIFTDSTMDAINEYNESTNYLHCS